jgi:hypothetical protein
MYARINKTYLDLRVGTAGIEFGWIANAAFKLFNLTICEVRKFGHGNDVVVSLIYLQIVKLVFSLGYLILEPLEPPTPQQ